LARPLIGRLSAKSTSRFPVTGDVTLDLEGARFVMSSDGRDSVASGAFWVGLERYEGSTFSVFAALVPECTSFADVGANTGLFSLAARALSDSIAVTAFEPFPAAADRIMANVAANRFRSIEIVRCAVSDAPGLLPLHFNRSLRLTQGASLREHPYATDRIDVPIVTLDEYYALPVRSAPDLLKVDVEGMEPLVLKGAANIVRVCRPTIICELNTPDCYAALRRFIQENRYLAFRLADSTIVADQELSTAGPVAQNRLLVHESRRRLIDVAVRSVLRG
jgi:FkbM family methyltransferase